MAWIAPATWGAGTTVTAAALNIQLRDNMKAIGDPWTAYTPALTGSGTTQGNAGMTGASRAAGKTIDFWAQAVLGSTSVIGSQIQLLLPFTAKATNQHLALYGKFTDTGSNFYLAFPYLASVTQVALGVIGTNGAAVAVSSTVPFTWTTNDVIFVSGTFEGA
jgi:hypothetical protein